MKQDFWHERWAAGQTGFHQDEVNPYLAEHWSSLGLPSGATVFVPLCGKSLDLAWLRAQGHPVVGNELSTIAVEAFFANQDIKPERTPCGALEGFVAAGYRLLAGDFFALTPADLGAIDAVYDRAALIALPPAMRRDYVAALRRLLPAGIPLLLVALEYDQAQMGGPPFAVMEAEVRALYADDFTVEHLARHDVLAENGNVARRGVERLHESIYRLRYRPGGGVEHH